jgi:Nif-specific regulatory protein
VGGRLPERVDVRIIAATHRDLDAAVARGEFREDLLYRLRVVPIHIPPLRERGEDVRVLAEHFVERYAEFVRRAPLAGSWSASRHAWLATRKLENAIRRALVLSTGGARARRLDFLVGD